MARRKSEGEADASKSRTTAWASSRRGGGRRREGERRLQHPTTRRKGQFSSPYRSRGSIQVYSQRDGLRPSSVYTSRGSWMEVGGFFALSFRREELVELSPQNKGKLKARSLPSIFHSLFAFLRGLFRAHESKSACPRNIYITSVT